VGRFLRLRGVLTHELSHVHLFGWRSSLFSAPPSWFTEGLTVAVSDGGGAEGVSEVEAAEALRKGYAIVVTNDGRWRDFASIRLEIEPPGDPSRDDFVTFRQRLAYREAAMFVACLRLSRTQVQTALWKRSLRESRWLRRRCSATNVISPRESRD